MAKTISVSPSNGDDTADLQKAFDDAVDAGPASTVELKAGKYCVTSPIIVRGFDGFWRGAGKQKTIIETCADPFPVPQDEAIDPDYPNDPLLPVRGPFVFVEVESGPPTKLEIKDLAIYLKGGTKPWYFHGAVGPHNLFLCAILVAGKRPTVVDGNISQVSLAVDNVEIKGSPGGTIAGIPQPINTLMSILVTGAIDEFSKPGVPGDFSVRRVESVKADIEVTGSHFARALKGLYLSGVTDSSIVIGGSPPAKNTYEIFGDPVQSYDASKSKIEVSYNEGTVVMGAWIEQGVQTLIGWDDKPQPGNPPELSEFVISHNKFNMKVLSPLLAGFNPGDAVNIVDWPLALVGEQAKSAEVLIEGNKFDGDGVWAGVDGLSARDVVVKNNIITGDFNYAGIALGYGLPGLALPGVNWRILGNNVQKAVGANADTWRAPIWLGPHSRGNTVVGAAKTNVLDEGTNNKLTGVTQILGKPVGPALKEALEQRRKLLMRERPGLS